MKYTVKNLGLSGKPVVVQLKKSPSALKIALWVVVILTFAPAALWLLFMAFLAIITALH